MDKQQSPSWERDPRYIRRILIMGPFLVKANAIRSNKMKDTL